MNKTSFKKVLTMLLAAGILTTGCASGTSSAPAESTVPAAAAAPASSFAAASEASSEAEPTVSGDLMVYTSAEDAFMTEVLNRFNAKYPDANAQYFRSGTEEVISKLKAEKMAGSVQADLIMVSDGPTFESLKADGLLSAYESPELANIYTEYVDPERMYYGTFPAAMGIMFNTTMVSEAPTGWKDLISEAAKDNAIMPSPLYSGTACNALLELTRTEGIGWEFYQSMYDNGMAVVNGNGGVVNSVSAGEKAYGIVCDSNALAAAAKGSPVGFIYPEEGVPATADPIGILADAKNRPAAEAFLDFMLSEEIQTLGRDLIGKCPVRKGIEGPDGSMPLEERTTLISDAKKLSEARDADKETFKEMFKQ
ncbi:extracellular solute-binding protein [Yanshouia hominis]|uniref:Extracellular solute-binding protein n=1 Tax=Yanshouia hominis TaxID=2763673 RepID=A0ABR7NLH6_9FIRM|nr:extracellular solute-binding protein [Yanshouia hominis]MBC8577268.1 extracellular solute-binding protein [Yanshouia hominis]